MQGSKIEQHYCQTYQGSVCYWLTSNLEKPLAKPANLKLVLFLHGVGGSGRYWFSYLEELARAPYPVVALAPDLLGFGASEKPDIDYTREVHLSGIRAVLRDCLSRASLSEFGSIELELVGHSMGGILAVLLADRLAQKDSALPGERLHLTKLALLGTPYASSRHNLEREVLRSPMNRAMLAHPLVCQIVHHSIQLLWLLVLFLIRKDWVKTALPYPVVADYMQHTCRSYTSSVHNIIFDTNLDQVLKSLQSQKAGLFQTLLVYSRTDKEVPSQHGQELAEWFSPCRLELIEQGNHQLLGQLALNQVLTFLF